MLMLQYGREGTAPDFEDSTGLNIAWSFIRPKIDRDSESYSKAVLKSQYGVYKREAIKRGDTLLSFDEWRQSQQPESSAVMPPSFPIMGAYPTAISNHQPETQLESATGKENMADKPPRAPCSTPAKSTRKPYGQYGWVKLSDEEYSRLLNDLGQAEVERCIAYIDEAAQSTGNNKMAGLEPCNSALPPRRLGSWQESR